MNPTTDPTTPSAPPVDQTMNAITQRRYGGPEVLEYGTVAVPEPGDDQVLIEVHAAAVNRGDALAMRGWPYAARLTYGPTRPRVDDIQVGDEVVGWATSGAFAPYATATAASVVPKPAGGDLAALSEMVDAGTLRPVIDRRFDLTESADAVAHIETARSRGKVVLTTVHGGLR